MERTVALQLAETIAAETGCDTGIERSPIRPSSWVVTVEGMVPIQIIRSWQDWHRRKSEILSRAQIAA